MKRRDLLSFQSVLVLLHFVRTIVIELDPFDWGCCSSCTPFQSLNQLPQIGDIISFFPPKMDGRNCSIRRELPHFAL